jgi:hypothetical protein
LQHQDQLRDRHPEIKAAFKKKKKKKTETRYGYTNPTICMQCPENQTAVSKLHSKCFNFGKYYHREYLDAQDFHVRNSDSAI